MALLILLKKWGENLTLPASAFGRLKQRPWTKFAPRLLLKNCGTIDIIISPTELRGGAAVAQGAVNPLVVGSNPTLGALSEYYDYYNASVRKTVSLCWFIFFNYAHIRAISNR